MTRLIAGDLASDPDDPALLFRARANIEERFEVVGLTEDLDVFASDLASVMGWEKPGPLERRIVNPNRPDEIDDPTRDAIQESNRLDMDLYDWAKSRL